MINKPCNGAIYRYKQNLYLGSRGEIVYKDSFIPMKKLSCKGCECCYWIYESLSDMISNGNIIIPNNLEDGELYYLSVTNISTDWETGVVDDFDFMFVKYKQ